MPKDHPPDESPESDDPVSGPCAQSLAVLAEVDPLTLGAAARVEHLVELERHAAWVASLSVQALAAVAGPGPQFEDGFVGGGDSVQELFAVEDGIQDEVAAALRVSGRAAGLRIAAARALVHQLPATRELLAAGGVSYAHALAVVDECERLSVSDAREVDARGLSRAETQTPGQLRRSVRRAAAAVCPMRTAAVVDAEFARREVHLFHDGGVMATITAELPAPDAIAVWNALTACAIAGTRRGDEVAAGGADTRSMAHKRADALTAWANRALDDPGVPVAHGRKRVETQVVIDLATLLGLADNPGEIVGYGPIPAVLARRLAGESEAWRRLVTDPVTGHVLDYGHRTYQPPAALREYVLARDRVCQFPGCAQPAFRCDIDHVVAFTATAEGGSTSADNLIVLCRRHHRLKTHNHWRVDITTPAQGPPGANSGGVVIQWTSPRGGVYQCSRPTPLEGVDAAGNEFDSRETSSQTRLEAELQQLLGCG